MTPNQAAHRELCRILADLADHSRRERVAALQTELALALERAHLAEDQRARVEQAALRSKEQLDGAQFELAQIRGECRVRMLEIRSQVVAITEQFWALESACRDAFPLGTLGDAHESPSERRTDPFSDADEAPTGRAR